METDVISLGGQCWVAKLLALMREGPTHLFDWVATTPSIVAHILEDSCEMFLNPEYFHVRGVNEGHIQHEVYETFVMDQIRGLLAGPAGHMVKHMMHNTIQRLPAMFQHNTEGGQTNLLATLEKRSGLLQTRLAGTQWKVLVFGFAIPW